MESWLQKRWYKVWEEFQAKDDRDRVWELIQSFYQEPHRYYHNLSHIAACLKISKKSLDRVIRLILLTKHHALSSTPEKMLMLDCDLSICKVF